MQTGKTHFVKNNFVKIHKYDWKKLKQSVFLKLSLLKVTSSKIALNNFIKNKSEKSLCPKHVKHKSGGQEIKFQEVKTGDGKFL